MIKKRIFLNLIFILLCHQSILFAGEILEKNEFDYDKYLYGNYVEMEKNYKESFEEIEKTAKQGNSHSQFNLGQMYYEGLGVEKDYKKAFQWIEKSAKQGNIESQLFLVKMFYFGEGVEKDL
jgi:TPR repeat protein